MVAHSGVDRALVHQFGLEGGHLLSIDSAQLVRFEPPLAGRADWTVTEVRL